MAESLIGVTMVLYFVGTVVFLIYLLRRSEFLSKGALALAGLGFLSHTLALLVKTVGLGHLPLMTFQEAMSFFAWTLVLVFLGVVLKRGLHVLGAFILPLSFLSLVSASIAPAGSPGFHPVFETVWVHVTLSMLGTVGFAVAFVAGIMYIMQDRMLKSKQFNAVYIKLPPLDFLDALNQRSILFGFPLLTLGILTGSLSAHLSLGSYMSWNPEQVWALITWIFYFAVLLGRVTVGWRAKKAAYLTIVGFAGVILTFVGVVLKNQGPLGT
ncbi:MAG: cytochrome c biogenesis protein [Nitrospirales bacterium]|nr:cytochrome c biogenesis protein CcsA [Nitrospira sp.]MDR4500210.1 cytochrome c biogenesis protein [Nitrospirales bacterium]